VDYTVEHVGTNRAIVSFSGRLDAGTVPEFKRKLKAIAAERAAYLLIDLSAVEFIDSSGLGGLVSVFKTVRDHDGTLALINVNGPVRAALELTRLDRVFEICDSRQSALAYLDRAAAH
jgi:anti-sigma B factor antagonist